tara:strand:+ start:387 stop:653 length:267 start_codon:yes stop_codon:yes gene_type:complete
MSFLGRFTLWGGIKRIAILITVVLLALITFIYWGINFPDGDWFIGGEDEKKELYEYIKFISMFIITMWVVLFVLNFVLKWILSGFFKK